VVCRPNRGYQRLQPNDETKPQHRTLNQCFVVSGILSDILCDVSRLNRLTNHCRLRGLGGAKYLT
jgi:hypothetical protein